MLVLALSLTISFHRPPLLILLGLLVYSQSFVRSQPSKLFFTTPSFPATIIHPINPMTDFSNKCSNKCNSPQFWYKLQLKQHPILHKTWFSQIFLQQSRKFIQEFSWYKIQFPQDPPPPPSHNFCWCFIIHIDLGFLLRPNDPNLTRPLSSHNFWKG